MRFVFTWRRIVDQGQCCDDLGNAIFLSRKSFVKPPLSPRSTIGAVACSAEARFDLRSSVIKMRPKKTTPGRKTDVGQGLSNTGGMGEPRLDRQPKVPTTL
jgi:hypothetical protein